MHALTRTVLIIDDDSDVRDALAAIFESKGWTVVRGDDGNIALDLALGNTPDLIVLDVMMPIQDGWETLAQLRDDERVGHIPVIMLTGVNDYELGMNYDVDLAGRKANARPPDAFIDKPLDVANLLATVTEIMGE